MRDAINNNPKVQIAVIGVLVLVVGLFLMMGMKKGNTGTSSTSASPATAAPGVAAGGTVPPAGTVPPTGGTISGSAGSALASPAPPVTAETVSPDALIPGPGLPKPVVKAWHHGDTIVLLIVKEGGVDDQLVRRSVESLSRESGTSVFVAPATRIARYSRITQGVGVDRVPALVVIRPRKESGSVPKAQVSYGFRDSQSVVQAVHDARYSGQDDLPYSPR